MAATLAQTATPIERDPAKYMTLIHGDPGVGKTTFASQIPGHYFAKTQEGTKGLQIFGDPITSWKEFIELGNAIIDAKKNGFKGQREITTLVIDTYDALWKMCAAERCKRPFLHEGRAQMFTSYEDAPFGKAYAATNAIILPTLRAIALEGIGVITIMHTKDTHIKYRGQDVIKYEPSLSASATDAIVGECDAVGYFTMEEQFVKEGTEIVLAETKRFSYWQPQFKVVAKHRLRGFPARLELPVENAYGVYLDAFTQTVNKLIDQTQTKKD